MPVFEIIVPAYNAESFLEAALDSVVAQTFEDWRILLVDDGSTDRTAAIGKAYAARLGPRMKYIFQPNAGLPAARNTAIRHAEGEFLALLDADDAWLPERLAKTFERAREVPEAGLLYGFNARIGSDGQLKDTFDRRNAHAEGAVAPFLYMRMLDLPCPTVTFRLSCIEKVGYFDETLRASEDRDLWIRLALQTKVALVPSVIALYRVSPHSMSTDIERMTKSQLRLVEKHYGQPGCGWRARRVALSWVFRQRAEALAERGRNIEALHSASRALAFYPFQGHAVRTFASILMRSLSRPKPLTSQP